MSTLDSKYRYMHSMAQYRKPEIYYPRCVNHPVNTNGWSAKISPIEYVTGVV